MAGGSSILDLAFAMDCTGSMGAYIKNATDNIRLIVDEIVTKEKVTVRLALIEYRDHPPQDSTFVTRVHSFTNTVSEMKGWLDQCSADGGGDAPEAVTDALNDVLNLPWDSVAAKICILISDAPPHGLDPNGDSFPSGCPAGHDPLAIVRKMAEKNITLYTVGVEPPIVPYRDFFMTIAHITGGQYVPMVDANRLAQMIIAGVREEISLDRLMHSARSDITREIRKSAAKGIDDKETALRLQKIFTDKKMHVNRMKNEAGATSTIAEESYSKCLDMADIQLQYKKSETVSNTKTSNMDYRLEEDSTVSFEQAKRIVQKAKNWNYSADEQDENSNPTVCKYRDKCYDHSSSHRAKYSHPENEDLSTRRNHETERNNTTTRHRERKPQFQNDDSQTPCKYQDECYDHSSYHRSKYSHPENNDSSTRRHHETDRNDFNTRNRARNSHSQNDDPQTPCKYQERCSDHTEYHRSKYSHPQNDHFSARRHHDTERNDHFSARRHQDTEGNDHHSTRRHHDIERNDHFSARHLHDTERNDHHSARRHQDTERNDHFSARRHQDTERHDHRPSCKHGATCYDHSDYHRTKYSHPTG